MANVDFCIYCRKETEYEFFKKTIQKSIKDKEYSFEITIARCKECGAEMSIPGLMDQNVKEIDEQYRAQEGLVSIAEIEALMKLYNIGKAPLSLALGFGEITVTRYLLGQIPSKEYSDIMRKAIESPAYMGQRLANNRAKLADAAYEKAMEAVAALEEKFSVSQKLLGVIAYVFKQLDEVTPLMLQKILYFAQGENLALRGAPLFPEKCEAWAHGPVFPQIYALFKDFSFNPIEDERFEILRGAEGTLTQDDRRILDLVLGTFGEYGGKTLERITHNEEPWQNARKGCVDWARSHEVISLLAIQEYFTKVNGEYNIATEKGLRRYIKYMLKKAI